MSADHWELPGLNVENQRTKTINAALAVSKLVTDPKMLTLSLTICHAKMFSQPMTASLFPNMTLLMEKQK